MVKHTPGPWFGHEDQGVYLGKSFEHPIFETGCGCCTDSTLKAADAQLIAAAPDLLEAADMALVLLEDFVDDPRVDVEINATIKRT